MFVKVPGREPVQSLHFHVKSRGVKVGRPLREYVEQRLASALGKFATRVVEVTVWLIAPPVARGIAERSCWLVLRLNGTRPITVLGRHADLHAAVGIAAKLAERAVAREITRRRDGQRRRLSRLAVIGDGSTQMT